MRRVRLSQVTVNLSLDVSSWLSEKISRSPLINGAGAGWGVVAGAGEGRSDCDTTEVTAQRRCAH